MRHTDFHHAIQIIEELAKQELAEALKTIGGEYVFDYENEECDDMIVVGAFKHSPGSEDILVTRAVLEDGEYLRVYGKPYQYQDNAESVICFMEAGYYGNIISAIPDTGRIKNVRDAFRNGAAYEKLSDALNRIV